MKGEDGILAHLLGSWTIDGLPGRLRGKGQLIRRDSDGCAKLDVQLEEFPAQAATILIPTPRQSGGTPKDGTGKMSQRMEEDIVAEVEDQPREHLSDGQ